MKNHFNYNMTEINQGSGMTLHSRFDCLQQNIIEQYLKEVSPIFIRQLQLLLKFPNQENSEFQYKSTPKKEYTSFQFTYRKITVNVEIPSSRVSNADNEIYVRYQVKYKDQEIFNAGYEQYFFKNTSHFENRVNNIYIAYDSKKFDMFIRMVDNLDDHLLELHRENGLSYDMVVDENKRQRREKILMDSFSVKYL